MVRGRLGIGLGLGCGVFFPGRFIPRTSENVFMKLKEKKLIHKTTIPAFSEGNLSIC